MHSIKYFHLFLILLTVTSCKEKVGWDQIPDMNGYWEIEKVVFPDGSERNYTVSTSIDYIEIKDQKGFRKKVQPKLNGTYDTSNDAEPFNLIEKKGGLTMYYKNSLSEWEEKISSLSQNSLTLTNQEGISYHYKRFEPINLE